MKNDNKIKQFTARIDSRLMRVITRESQRTGESKNEILNRLLTLGLIALAEKRRKATAMNSGPPMSN